MSLKNRKVVRTIEIIFGLLLILMGVNAFLQLSPAPEFNAAGTAFLTALFATGYILPVMAIAFLLVGVMFLLGKCSALGAVILFPFTVNFILFHIFLDWAGWWSALIFTILNLYVMYAHWNSYKGMCK